MAAQTGYSLATKGWTAFARGLLLPGDWLQTGYRLYRNLAVANADGSGHATRSIWPQIRESPNDGDTIVTSNTKGLFRLTGNLRKYSMLGNRPHSLQFDVRKPL